MVQSRTGSGKTAAFGIPFANGIVNAADKFVQALVLLPTRELALQVARRAGADRQRTAASRWCRSTAARRWARQIEHAQRGRADRRRHAGARARSPAPRHARRSIASSCARPRRVRRDAVDGLPGGHRGDPRAAARRRGRRCCSRRRCPTRSSAWRAATCARPEFLKLSGDYIGVHEIQHVYYIVRGIEREQRAAAHPRLRGARSRRSSSATRARRPRASPSSCASRASTPRRSRSDLSQTDRERVHGAHARRGTSSSSSPPTSPRAASTSRTCRTSSTTRSPSRPRSTSTAPAAPAARARRAPRSR